MAGAYRTFDDAQDYLHTHGRRGMAYIDGGGRRPGRVIWSDAETAFLGKYEYFIRHKIAMNGGDVEKAMMIFDEWKNLRLDKAFGNLIVDVKPDGTIVYFDELGSAEEPFKSLFEKYAYLYNFPEDAMFTTLGIHMDNSKIVDGKLLYRHRTWNPDTQAYDESWSEDIPFKGFVFSNAQDNRAQSHSAVEIHKKMLRGELKPDDVPDAIGSTFLYTLAAGDTPLIRYIPLSMERKLRESIDCVIKFGCKYPWIRHGLIPWMYLSIFE